MSPTSPAGFQEDSEEDAVPAHGGTEACALDHEDEHWTPATPQEEQATIKPLRHRSRSCQLSMIQPSQKIT
eukprot:3346173-Amphidinium_carterae.1